VGLKSAGSSLAFLFLSLSSLSAAPVLRLSSATIGPIALPSAGASNTQTLEAYNAGDGALALTLETSASWITASLGASRQCRNLISAVGQACSTIQVVLNTAGLPQGLTTGTLTVKDPNAVDAPQVVTVTVRIGTIAVDVAPGGSRDVLGTVSSPVFGQSSNPDWLSLVLLDSGSFRFNYRYNVHFQPAATMAPGTYPGSVTITGSATASDNQTLPVSMRVTTLPIAVPSTDRLTVTLAQGAPPLIYPFSPFVQLTNAGQGTLTVSDTSVIGAFIKKDAVASFFAIDPTGLPVGTSSGSIVFTSNAVGGTTTVPVDLQIVAKGSPSIFYQGVLDNATFVPGDTVAQGDILVVKGDQLSFSPFTPGPAPPLPTKLGGTTVLVNNTVVPLFYTSYGQIAFQMPVDMPIGTAIVQVQRDDGSISNKASVQVAARAPRLLVAVNQNGSVNSASAPAHVGDALTIYAIGFGQTSPAVATGAPSPAAEPLARVTPVPIVGFGSALSRISVDPLFAGLTPTFAGLFQVNVVVPDGTPSGAVDLVVAAGDTASNTLQLYVQ
jgi:uncharacterized protein (TIGR03437 family)